MRQKRHMWCLLIIASALTHGYSQSTPTVCEDESCKCDSFTRILCNCTKDFDEVTLRQDGPYRVPSGTTGIVIYNCARVYFLPETVQNLFHLRNIELYNIRHVYLNERSLYWSPYPKEYAVANPGLKIIINNSTINEMASHSIKGRIDDVTITDSRINVIKPFALSSITGLKNLKLFNNIFDTIETQALKKFSVNNVIIDGMKTKTIPSRFFSDVEILSTLRIDNLNVGHISSVAFLVTGPKRVLINSNTINVLDSDSLHVTTRGPITFRNNTIKKIGKGAFFGFSASPEITSIAGAQDLLLDNNTFTDIKPEFLIYNTSSISLRIDDLNLNSTCSCELANYWKNIDDNHGGINCWYVLEERYTSLSSYVDTRCGSLKQKFWIFMVVGVVIILAVGISILVFVVIKEREKKKRVQIVMPDGKTYKETELHIVVERAELLTTDF